MKEFTFPVEGTPQISLRLPTGDARIVDGDSGTVVVQLQGRSSTLDRFVVEARGNEIVIEPERGGGGRWTSVDVTIRCGVPLDARARLAAADFRADRSLASAHIETASGDVELHDVSGDVTVRSASGDVRVGAVGGGLELASASGDLRAESVGGVSTVKTMSGDVLIAEAGGEVNAKSVSGEISVPRFHGSWFDAKTMSGDVTIGVAPGRKFEVSFQTLSGDVRTDFPVGQGDGASARLSVKTVSGDINVQGAPERR
ncbi:MAG TPA: DUF4097 family beta strand repeat-containing protein [Acidimicrobiia bacterium]|nr:DUF4097 family beta strand repeat-containing protein [Acidimicrobiia bacterium]